MARVGLLEDNFRIARLCATMLHYAGHEVIVYERARECLCALMPDEMVDGDSKSVHMPESIKPSPLPVEILILDLYLPDISGLQVLRRLQSCPYTQSLPLILCTAAPNHDVIQALRIVPHATLLEKPFKIQALNLAVTNALSSLTS